MTYVEGFVLAVPTANKQAYRKHAEEAAPIFREFGVQRMVEAWGDDVPRGKTTDFYGAVQAKDDESVLFSWLEYASKAERDSANAKFMSDPRMEEMMKSMPFDGQRMIIGGFESIVEAGAGGGMGYVDGFVLPVLPGREEDYREMARKASTIFLEHGATRVVEALQNDVPEGKVTDFFRAVKAQEGEKIVYSWIEWPSKEARVAGWEKVMADERMKPDFEQMPFDGPRMFWAGFTPILDVGAEARAEAEQPIPA
jgi:uncharacterized protein YbaA (DUF1428 family)